MSLIEKLAHIIVMLFYKRFQIVQLIAISKAIIQEAQILWATVYVLEH